MFSFAQTNLQLHRQLRSLEYSDADIDRVMAAYDIAVPMFSGQYRVSGKPFIAHLVGTASILASRRCRAELLVAGLLHAAYMVGDIGFHMGRRQTRRRREHLSGLLGAEAESLVAGYDDLRWRPDTIRRYREAFDVLDEQRRELLVIRLANTYEEFMDDGMWLNGPAKTGRYAPPAVQSDLLQLADLVGWPELAGLLRDVFADYNRALAQTPSRASVSRSTLRLPPSAARKPLPAAQGWIARRLRRLSAPAGGN